MKTNARIGFAVVLTITVTLATGCKSGGSKWAWWNPMSRSAADTSLVARTAPALPSDSATPLIEGVNPPAVTAVASTGTPAATPNADAAPFVNTPPAMPQKTLPPTNSVASATPAQEAAKLGAVPKISSPAAQPYIASTKTAPTKTTASTDAYAASGPYDPNAYQPSAPAQVQSNTPASDNRYGGLGDRYASAASNTVPTNTATESVPDFSKPATPVTPSTEDRYGIGGRYASVPVTPAPVTPAPATTTVAAATPPPVTPIASESNAPAVVGTLPATSVYSTASAVPTTTPTSGPNSGRSEIRLTSLPGEYRPGGTGTYKAGVSVATRPGTSVPTTTAPATTAPAATPRYR